jgi:poly(A) polymerase
MTRDSTEAPPLDVPPEQPPADLPPEALTLPEEPELPVLHPATKETAEIDPAKLDPEALKVVYRLRQHGHQAYLVGGCVRDLLLGRTPKDFDIATSATPAEVRATFRNCRLIGRRFRLAHVYFRGGKVIEVSTFRANPTDVEELQATLVAPVEEEAGEEQAEDEDDLLITHDNVFGSAEEDARRRDFTINGLFYDVVDGRVIDYVRGLRDLDERYIRTIGNPEVRMREDPVRILRAVRFACKLGLDIESRTYAAMEMVVEDLPRCAPPRLLEETFRLIRGGISTDSLKLLGALDALKLLLPPVADYLRRAGPQGEERFYRFTRALDVRIQAGAAFEDSVLLATLLLPIVLDAPAPPEDEARPTLNQAVEDLLAELVRNARLPRRIAERCRMILFAQRTLSGQRRRRGSLASFRRHPLFEEALTVFEVWVEATGEHQEALERWRAGEAPSPTEPLPEGARRPRSRRRRRGRGEGGPKGDSELAGPTSKPENPS